MHFYEMNCVFLLEITRRFDPKDPLNNTSALIQVMDGGQPGNMTLFEPMMKQSTSFEISIGKHVDALI